MIKNYPINIEENHTFKGKDIKVYIDKKKHVALKSSIISTEKNNNYTLNEMSGFLYYHKIIELNEYSFVFEEKDYKFILEIHFTMDEKQLFKKISFIIENNFLITNRINSSELKEVKSFIFKLSDFPIQHHYNPRFLIKGWENKTNELGNMLIKKFTKYDKEVRTFKINDKISKTVFSEQNLYTMTNNSYITTIEKGIIHEIEVKLLDLLNEIDKYQEVKLLDKTSKEYILAILLFFRARLKNDKELFYNCFNALDIIRNDYSNIDNFFKHILRPFEKEIKLMLGEDFNISIFKTSNSIGFFLSEEGFTTDSNYDIGNIQSIIIPITPEHCFIMSRDFEYAKNFDNKIEGMQRSVLINHIHSVAYSKKEVSLVYKNNIEAERFISSILDSKYPEYFNLPDLYKDKSIISLWNGDEKILHMIIDIIVEKNKKLDYFNI